MHRPSPIAALLALVALTVSIGYAPARAQTAERGEIEIRDGALIRDGRPWIPHGFYQIAFEVAPGNLARADHPFWTTAHDGYTPDEYAQMREAGADTVRIQVAQAAADPASPLADSAFVGQAIAAVRAARERGLTVILCVQGESHVPGVPPLALPGQGTRRVWRIFAPLFADDRGVLFELLNEPQPKPSPQAWRSWKAAMMETLRTVRASGARNVVIADGLQAGQVLDGAPLLDDAQVAYASHPYANDAYGQTPAAWEAKFGRFSHRAPVIISEWNFGGYYCDPHTPEATVEFLRYINDRHIGLVAGLWDWQPAGFGSARWDFPIGKFSTYRGRRCHQPGYGLGEVVEAWYRTGEPPDHAR